MEVGLNVASSPVSIDYCGLSGDTKQLVLAFYNSNEVSWQAPGRKDRVIIRETRADGSTGAAMIYTNIAERSPSPVFH